MSVAPFARQPAGAPTGGQFAQVRLAEPGVDLDLWDTQQGTYEFPPQPRTAEDVIRFWSSVEIPDEVCFATRVAYADRQRRDVMRELDAYERRNPLPRQGTARYDRYRADQKAHITQWEADRRYPQDIVDEWMRPSIRAVRMWDAARWFLKGDEQEKVFKTRVRMPGDLVYTVEELAGILRAEGLVLDMTDIAKRVDIQTSWEEDRSRS